MRGLLQILHGGYASRIKVRIRRWEVIVADPEIRAAVQDVDRSLLDWTLGLTPLERLRSASNATRTLKKVQA